MSKPPTIEELKAAGKAMHAGIYPPGVTPLTPSLCGINDVLLRAEAADVQFPGRHPTLRPEIRRTRLALAAGLGQEVLYAAAYVGFVVGVHTGEHNAKASEQLANTFKPASGARRRKARAKAK